MNINEATESDLLQLKGIGLVKAKAIVQYRKELGGTFTSVDQLLLVKGISRTLYATIAPSLILEDPVSPLSKFSEDLIHELPVSTSGTKDFIIAKTNMPHKKEAVRLCFNPGIIAIRDLTQLQVPKWPKILIDELKNESAAVQNVNDIAQIIMQQKQNLLEQSGISSDRIHEFIESMNRKNFKEEGQRAIHFYTWSDAGIHGVLNTALNSNRQSFANRAIQGWEVVLQCMIRYIKSASDISNLPSLVYRGCIATSMEVDFYVSVGCKFIWKGFISTSRKKEVAMQFALDAASKRKLSPVVFCIKMLSVNAGAADITLLSFYPAEDEVLFLPGSAFEIEEVLDHSVYIEVKCKQIASPLFRKT